MVVESWESDEVNLDTPFRVSHFFERLQIAYTKRFTMELMDVSRLWYLNEKKSCSILSPRSKV